LLSCLLVPVALSRNLSLTHTHAVLPRDGFSLFSNYNAGDSECALPNLDTKSALADIHIPFRGACGAWQQGRCGELVSSVWGKKGSGAVRLWDEKEEGGADAPVMQT
jgi:hypothetical protein